MFASWASWRSSAAPPGCRRSTSLKLCGFPNMICTACAPRAFASPMGSCWSTWTPRIMPLAYVLGSILFQIVEHGYIFYNFTVRQRHIENQTVFWLIRYFFFSGPPRGENAAFYSGLHREHLGISRISDFRIHGDLNLFDIDRKSVV